MYGNILFSSQDIFADAFKAGLDTYNQFTNTTNISTIINYDTHYDRVDHVLPVVYIVNLFFGWLQTIKGNYATLAYGIICILPIFVIFLFSTDKLISIACLLNSIPFVFAIDRGNIGALINFTSLLTAYLSINTWIKSISFAIIISFRPTYIILSIPLFIQSNTKLMALKIMLLTVIINIIAYLWIYTQISQHTHYQYFDGLGHYLSSYTSSLESIKFNNSIYLPLKLLFKNSYDVAYTFVLIAASINMAFIILLSLLKHKIFTKNLLILVFMFQFICNPVFADYHLIIIVALIIILINLHEELSNIDFSLFFIIASKYFYIYGIPLNGLANSIIATIVIIKYSFEYYRNINQS